MKLSTAKRIQSLGAILFRASLPIAFIEWLFVGDKVHPFLSASICIFGGILFYLGTWKVNDHNRNPYRGNRTNCKCHR